MLATLFFGQATAALFDVGMLTFSPNYFREGGGMTYLKDGRLAYSMDSPDIPLKISIDESGHASVGGDRLGVSSDGFVVVNSEQGLDLEWGTYTGMVGAYVEKSVIKYNHSISFYVCNDDEGNSYEPHQAKGMFPIAWSSSYGDAPANCQNPMMRFLQESEETVQSEPSYESARRARYSAAGISMAPYSTPVITTEIASTYLTGVYVGADVNVTGFASGATTAEPSYTQSTVVTKTNSGSSSGAAGTTHAGPTSTTPTGSPRTDSSITPSSSSAKGPSEFTDSSASQSPSSAQTSSVNSNAAGSIGASLVSLIAIFVNLVV